MFKSAEWSIRLQSKHAVSQRLIDCHCISLLPLHFEKLRFQMIPDFGNGNTRIWLELLSVLRVKIVIVITDQGESTKYCRLLLRWLANHEWTGMLVFPKPWTVHVLCRTITNRGVYNLPPLSFQYFWEVRTFRHCNSIPCLDFMFFRSSLAKRIAIYVHILGLMTQHSLTVSLNILPVTGAFEKRSWWKTTDTVDLICKSNSSTKQLGSFYSALSEELEDHSARYIHWISQNVEAQTKTTTANKSLTDRMPAL